MIDFSWVTNFWDSFVSLVGWILRLPYHVVDSVLSFLEGLLAIGSELLFIDKLSEFVSLYSISSVLTALPEPALYVTNILHFGDALLIIGLTITARLIVNLIPAAFTRI